MEEMTILYSLKITALQEEIVSLETLSKIQKRFCRCTDQLKSTTIKKQLNWFAINNFWRWIQYIKQRVKTAWEREKIETKMCHVIKVNNITALPKLFSTFKIVFIIKAKANYLFFVDFWITIPYIPFLLVFV